MSSIAIMITIIKLSQCIDYK